MGNKALLELEGKNSQVAGMSERKTIISMEMCAVIAYGRPIRSTVSLPIRLAIRIILYERLDASQMQRNIDESGCAISTIKVVSGYLLKNVNLLAPISTFASNYDETSWIVSRKKKKSEEGQKENIRETPTSSPTSDPSQNDDIPSEEKKIRRVARDIKREKCYVCPQDFFRTTLGVWRQLKSPIKSMTHRVRQEQRWERRTKLSSQSPANDVKVVCKDTWLPFRPPEKQIPVTWLKNRSKNCQVSKDDKVST